MRFCELRQKEVINMCSCTSLGYVIDLLFDPCNGCITDIIVPGPNKILGLIGCDSEYVIPWKKVIKIGCDIILVEICEEETLKKCRL